MLKQGTSTKHVFRTIYDEHGTLLDVLWFYDTEKSRLVWVLPETFFHKSKEELDNALKILDFAAFSYCEMCDELQIPFYEHEPIENTKINNQ